MLREHLFHCARPLCAAQAVAHGDIRRADDEHAVLHDEVIDLRDTAGIGIFDRHHAVIARAVADSFKNIAEAGQKGRLLPREQAQGSAVGKRARRALTNDTRVGF